MYTSFFMPNSKLLSTSKGVQPKKYLDGIYYKYDTSGYEGLSEILAYRLLLQTNLAIYKHMEYLPLVNSDRMGCQSPDLFVTGNSITLYRALLKNFSTDFKGVVDYYMQHYDIEFFSFYEFILCFIRDSLCYDAADFFSILFQFDRLILNTDRHFNNVLFGNFSKGWEPIVFDCGAAFFSDTTLFSSCSIEENLRYALCKPFHEQFDRQVEIAQAKSFARLEFSSNRIELTTSDLEYNQAYISRVKNILEYQMTKYYPEVQIIWD